MFSGAEGLATATPDRTALMLALAVGTPYTQATLTIHCTNQAVLDEWTRESVILKIRS